jgi:hypothetical protein
MSPRDRKAPARGILQRLDLVGGTFQTVLQTRRQDGPAENQLRI